MKQGSLNSKNWVIASIRKSKKLKELYYPLDSSWARRCVVSYQIINGLNPTKQFCALFYMQQFFELSILLQLNCKNCLRGSVLNVNYAARLFNNEVCGHPLEATRCHTQLKQTSIVSAECRSSFHSLFSRWKHSRRFSTQANESTTVYGSKMMLMEAGQAVPTLYSVTSNPY